MSESKSNGSTPENAQQQSSDNKENTRSPSMDADKGNGGASKRPRCDQEAFKSPLQTLRSSCPPNIPHARVETAPWLSAPRLVSGNSPKVPPGMLRSDQETIMMLLAKQQQIETRLRISEEVINKLYNSRPAADPNKLCRDSVGLRLHPDLSGIQLDIVTDPASKYSNYEVLRQVVSEMSVAWQNVRSNAEIAKARQIRDDKEEYEKQLTSILEKHLQSWLEKQAGDANKCCASQAGRLYGDRVWLAVNPQGELRVNLNKKQAVATGHKILETEDIVRLIQQVQDEEKRFAATQTEPEAAGGSGLPVIEIEDEIDCPIDMTEKGDTTMETDGTEKAE